MKFRHTSDSSEFPHHFDHKKLEVNVPDKQASVPCYGYGLLCVAESGRKHLEKNVGCGEF